MKKNNKKKVNVKKICIIVAIVLTVLVLAAVGIGFYYYQKSIKALETIANQNTEITTYGVYVMKDSKAEAIEDLNGKQVASQR